MYTQLSPLNNVRFRGSDKQANQKPVNADSLKAAVGEIKEMNQQAMNSVPLARQLKNEKNHALGSLTGLAIGGVMGPFVGIGLDKLSGYNKPIVKASQFISTKTTGFSNWYNGLNIGGRIRNFLEPVKVKIFKPENYNTFMKGYTKHGGLMGANVNLRNAAAEAGEFARARSFSRSVMTLKEVDKLGVLGRRFGRSAIFIKKNLTGTMGVINGIFAAMTLSSVLNAKKGEKVSTFMEEFLGTWVGSIGGFRMFENILRGCAEFANPPTRQVAAKAVLPTMAKFVNKIPLKGFLVPLLGAMVTSAVMQKVSHTIFGEPTRQEPKVIDSVDSFNAWLNQTGWSHEEIAAVQDQVKEHVENQMQGQAATKEAA